MKGIATTDGKDCFREEVAKLTRGPALGRVKDASGWPGAENARVGAPGAATNGSSPRGLTTRRRLRGPIAGSLTAACSDVRRWNNADGRRNAQMTIREVR